FDAALELPSLLGRGGAVWLAIFAYIAAVVLFGGAFIHGWTHLLDRRRLVRIVMGLIIADGVLALLSSLALRAAAPDQSLQGLSVGGEWALSIFITHLLACLFLPLTPKEALRPLIPLLGLQALFTLFSGDAWVVKIFVILLLPLIGAPGALICWYRQSKFREKFTNRMVKSRFGALRQELSNARMIHEALFPKPAAQG